MKKTLTILCSIGLSLGMLGQTLGLQSDGFYDDFNQEDSYTDLWWWTKSSTGDVDKDASDPSKGKFCANESGDGLTKCLAYSAPYTRSGGKQVFTVDQPSAGWTPSGLNLGATVDLSSNSGFELILNNPNSYGVLISIDFTDQAGNFGNATTTGARFMVTVPANSTNYKWELDLSDLRRFAWPGGQTCDAAYPGSIQSGVGYCYWDDGIDESKISDISFTFSNPLDSGDPLYEHLGLTSASVEFVSLKVGSALAGDNSISMFSKEKLNVYPNPVSGNKIVSFGTELKNIRVVNLLGEVAFSIAKASSINLNNLSSGVYFIRSTQGTAKVVVK